MEQKETLKDIRDVKIREDVDLEERKKEYLRQIGNPYLFCCGDMTVHVSYAKEGPSLEECIEEYLKIGQ